MMWDVASPFIWLLVLWGGYRAFRHSTPSTASRTRRPTRMQLRVAEDIAGVSHGWGDLRGARTAAGLTQERHGSRMGGVHTSEASLDRGGSPPTVYRPRMVVAYAENPCDHPYDEQPLDQLYNHLYENHFEVFNMVGEKGPGACRREHASDHGLVLR